MTWRCRTFVEQKLQKISVHLPGEIFNGKNTIRMSWKYM